MSSLPPLVQKKGQVAPLLLLASTFVASAGSARGRFVVGELLPSISVVAAACAAAAVCEAAAAAVATAGLEGA